MVASSSAPLCRQSNLYGEIGRGGEKEYVTIPIRVNMHLDRFGRTLLAWRCLASDAPFHARNLMPIE